MLECRIATAVTALRRWDQAPAAACLAGVRCWGRHCRMRIAEDAHRCQGPRLAVDPAACFGCKPGRQPVRWIATALYSQEPAPVAAGLAGARKWARAAGSRSLVTPSLRWIATALPRREPAPVVARPASACKWAGVAVSGSRDSR